MFLQRVKPNKSSTFCNSLISVIYVVTKRLSSVTFRSYKIIYRNESEIFCKMLNTNKSVAVSTPLCNWAGFTYKFLKCKMAQFI